MKYLTRAWNRCVNTKQDEKRTVVKHSAPCTLSPDYLDPPCPNVYLLNFLYSQPQ